MLAPEQRETELDEWTWAVAGHQGLMPFTRYCLHVAKGRYQAEVYRRLRPVSEVIRETDTTARDVLRVLDETGRRTADAATLVAADASLQHQQLRDAGLLWTLTRLQEMEQTADIARTNARRHAPTCTTAHTGDTLFARDDATLSWLVGQLGRDVKYLDALEKRATALHAVASAAVQGALAQRRDRLTVLQTSVIGALVMALAGIQAFTYSPPVPDRLQGPLICLLTVIAVALPLLIGRWTGVVPGIGPYRWTDLAAAIGLGAATGWFVSATAWHLTADRPAPHPMTAAAVATGALAVLLVTWLLGRARTRPAP